MKNRFTLATVSIALCFGFATGASADTQSVDDTLAAFVQDFNADKWESVQTYFADDAVFHRANAPEVQVGPADIKAILSDPIGDDGGWNVKFVTLSASDSIEGEDGRIVQRGPFVVSAGAKNDECYAGSFLATWVGGADWKMQTFTWQDVKVDASSHCIRN